MFDIKQYNSTTFNIICFTRYAPGIKKCSKCGRGLENGEKSEITFAGV